MDKTLAAVFALLLSVGSAAAQGVPLTPPPDACQVTGNGMAICGGKVARLRCPSTKNDPMAIECRVDFWDAKPQQR
jgi:hypothetical protein